MWGAALIMSPGWWALSRSRYRLGLRIPVLSYGIDRFDTARRGKGRLLVFALVLVFCGLAPAAVPALLLVPVFVLVFLIILLRW